MGLRRVRGVRTSLPQNTVVGRRSGGKGAAELLDLDELARDLQTYGAGAAGGPAGLAAIGDGHILANLSGSSAAPIDKSLTQLLDYVMGSTRGMILRRGISGWEALALGSNGKLLQSNGTDAAWATVTTTGSIATDTDVSLTSLANKDLLYYQTSDSKWHNVTFSALLDAVLGTTQGSIMYRSSTAWTALGPDTAAGKVLQTQGTGANPAYATVGASEWLNSCSMATTAALPACTYANGSAGIGATLTGNVNGALAAQDGIAAVVNFRLLVKNQADSKQNGLYDITQVGTVGTPFILTRAKSFDGSLGSYINNGAITYVCLGTVHGNSAWAVQATIASPPLYVFGTDTNTWLFVFGTNVITSSSIATATDASVSAAANNDFFQYQTSDSKWHNRTVTQATASLNAMVGDSGSGGTKGLAPAPASGDAAAGKFLKADATYAVPPAAVGGLYGVGVTIPTTSNTGLSTWLNQGSSTFTDVANGIVLDTVTTTDNLRIRYATAPATPYSIKALISWNPTANLGSNVPRSGIGFSDATKLHIHGWQYSGPGYIVDKWNSGSSFNGNDVASTIVNYGLDYGPWWLAISDDGTTVKFYRSHDGVTWGAATFSVSRASGFLGSSGYTKVCFYTRAGGVIVSATLLAWIVTASATP